MYKAPEILYDNFQLDERLHASSFWLIDWPLSRVLLKNNKDYPWLILVPRKQNIIEITDLSQSERYQLMDEIHHVSIVVQDIFNPDKINIGALGNIVAQFHMHVIARFQHDPLWPEGIWQSRIKENVYDQSDSLIRKLINRLSKNSQTLIP